MPVKKSSRPAFGREDSTKERKTEETQWPANTMAGAPAALHWFPVKVVKPAKKTFQFLRNSFLILHCLGGASIGKTVIIPSFANQAHVANLLTYRNRGLYSNEVFIPIMSSECLDTHRSISFDPSSCTLRPD